MKILNSCEVSKHLTFFKYCKKAVWEKHISKSFKIIARKNFSKKKFFPRISIKFEKSAFILQGDVEFKICFVSEPGISGLEKAAPPVELEFCSRSN